MMQIPEGNSCPVNFPEVLRRYDTSMHFTRVLYNMMHLRSQVVLHIHMQSFPKFPTLEASRTETTENWVSKPAKSLSGKLAGS